MSEPHVTTVAHPQTPTCTGCREGAEFDVPFSMAFQPIVDATIMQPYAYEALVRGPEGQSALSVLSQVTDENRYAFDQVCRVRAIECAMAAGLMDTDARLSINFLPNAVYSPLACIQLTLKTARAHGLALDRLIFEFTENEEMVSPQHVEAIIDSYRKMGFSVALDDFGAGHAGLDLFVRFTPDLIKLDMELIRGLDADPRRLAIVRGIVSMCEELGTTIIAEGVETSAEANALQELGVRYLQGYFFARPGFQCLPLIEMESRADKRATSR